MSIVLFSYVMAGAACVAHFITRDGHSYLLIAALFQMTPLADLILNALRNKKRDVINHELACDLVVGRPLFKGTKP